MLWTDGGRLHPGSHVRKQPAGRMGGRPAKAVLLDRSEDLGAFTASNHHVSLQQVRLPGVVCPCRIRPRLASPACCRSRRGFPEDVMGLLDGMLGGFIGGEMATLVNGFI